MSRFRYTALQPKGGEASGTIEAADRGEALRKLDRSGLQPLKVEPVSPSASDGEATSATNPLASKPAAETPPGGIRPSRKQVTLFTEQLADLLEAGLALEPALQILEEREEVSNLRLVAAAIRREIREGTSFSQALAVSSPSFGELYQNLAAAGELSGSLPVLLRHQVTYLQNMQNLRSQLVSALIYPAFLTFAAVAVSLIFIFYLIPQLAVLMQSAGGELPPIMTGLIAVNVAIEEHGWFVLVLGILTIVAVLILLRSSSLQSQRDRAKIELPLFGPLISTRHHVELLVTLANLVGNGLPLLKALELCASAARNSIVRSRIGELATAVAEGAALSRSMKQSSFWPPLLIDMVRVGEETGQLAASLERAGKRFERDLSEKTDRLTALIQPVIILIMACSVGLMAYVLVSAIYDTIGALRQR